MHPSTIFQRYDTQEMAVKPINSAKERRIMVDQLDLHQLRQVVANGFSPRIQSSIVDKAAKRLKAWPKDDEGNFIL